MGRALAALRDPRAATFRLAARLGSETLQRLVTAFPVTYHDKVRYKMARDRRRLIADFADKVEAKRYVARTVGAEYAVPVLAVFEDAASIGVEGLPEEFVMKVSHASGRMVFVRRDAPVEARLEGPEGRHPRPSVRPEAFDVERARSMFAAWLARPHGVRKGEWAYGVHAPRVLVEPMLRSPSGAPPGDVKIHVMNGRVAVVSITTVRDGQKSVRRFLPDGSPAPHAEFRDFYGSFRPVTEPPPTPPTSLPTMVEVAERLGAETDYLRVDLLDLEDRFVVGELTNYPASGLGRYRPASYERWLGRQWTVPARYGGDAGP